MTRLEAIKRLEWLTMVGRNVDSVIVGGDDMECLEMVIDALREQEERSKGCGWCKQFAGVPLRGFTEHGCQSITVKFCPMRGRILEEV